MQKSLSLTTTVKFDNNPVFNNEQATFSFALYLLTTLRNNNQTRLVNKFPRWSQRDTGERLPSHRDSCGGGDCSHREVTQLEPAKQLFGTEQIAQFERRLAKPASITDFNYTNKQSLWRVDESLESLAVSQSADSFLLSSSSPSRGEKMTVISSTVDSYCYVWQLRKRFTVYLHFLSLL